MFDDLAAAGGPVFLFVHYYDAHSDFGARGNRRPYWAPDEQTAQLPELCRQGLCAPEPDSRCATGFLLWASQHPEEIPPETRNCLHRAYLAGVAALDVGLGRFLEAFSQRRLGETSLLVVTSDHGEEFGEHGQFIHAQTHRETTQVPLLVRAPGRAPSRRAERAQLADVLPTILAAVGSEVPETVTGRPLFDGGREVPAALAQNKYRPQRYAWIEARWKLVHDYVSGESWLYDLAADPGEATDLGSVRPEVVERLRRRLDRHLRDLGRRREAAGGGAVEGGELPDEVRRRLEALGYVD
jgi:arylsulfatase A-like enzyme